MDWASVVAMGELLPGVETATSYGRPALKVRGKAIAVAGREPDNFVLMAALEEVDVLMETEPQVFFQTDHYKGWPAVLARYETADPARIAMLLERAWTRRASKAQRTARAGERDQAGRHS
jgi:hypothetical protein